MTEWRCTECDTANDAAASRCVVCDGTAPASAGRPAGSGPASPAGAPVPPIPTPISPGYAPEGRAYGPASSAPLPASPVSEPEWPAHRRKPRATVARWRVAGVALAVLAGLVGGGYLLLDAGAQSATDQPSDAVTEAGPEAGPEAAPEAASDVVTEPAPGIDADSSGALGFESQSASPTVPAQIGMVAIVTGDARATEVAALFDFYFAGINAHDASVAAKVFAPGGVVDPNDPGQVANFGADTATTQDSNVRLLEVVDAAEPGELIATVSFTSTQAPEFGPPERPGETCTDWRLDFRLTRWHGELRIFGTERGAVSAPCV
ncbi:hypothetical protein ACIA8K_01580 [Catenuloplanes sp. NPDC051500]|uniref:hypothetical protein n=1 Tax=Catenuloplanes sp. NPDC051500 TaxID=3363959 RepID=UPI00379E612A